jgi:hypothetical protein
MENPFLTIICEDLLHNARITKLRVESKYPYGVERQYDNGSWRSEGRSFATLQDAHAYSEKLSPGIVSTKAAPPLWWTLFVLSLQQPMKGLFATNYCRTCHTKRVQRVAEARENC